MSTLLVATSFPVVESIAGDLDSAVLAVVRFALAALLFLPLVVARHGRRVLPTWRSLVRYALLSAPLVGFFFGMFEALRTTTAVHTAALFTFAPAFAAVFSLLLLHERFSLRRVLGLGLGMLGASWVALGGDPERLVALHFVAGDAIFLAATASLGLYGALVKRLHRGEPLEIMTFWTLVTGTAWLLLLGHDPLTHVPWTAFEPRVLVAVGYLALFTTLITFLLTQSATLVIGPTRALSYTYLNPILVAVLAWTLGADALGLAALPGVGLTFASMVVLQTDGWRGARRGGRRPPAGTEEAVPVRVPGRPRSVKPDSRACA